MKKPNRGGIKAFNQNQRNYEICKGKLFGYYIQNQKHKNSDFINSWFWQNSLCDVKQINKNLHQNCNVLKRWVPELWRPNWSRQLERNIMLVLVSSWKTNWNLHKLIKILIYALIIKSLQAGIEFKKNLRVCFGKYGGLKLEYFWVAKSKNAKSFIRGFMMNDFAFLLFPTQKYSSFNPPYFQSVPSSFS